MKINNSCQENKIQIKNLKIEAINKHGETVMIEAMYALSIKSAKKVSCGGVVILGKITNTHSLNKGSMISIGNQTIKLIDQVASMQSLGQDIPIAIQGEPIGICLKNSGLANIRRLVR